MPLQRKYKAEPFLFRLKEGSAALVELEHVR
jgi:hypothetical protein